MTDQDTPTFVVKVGPHDYAVIESAEEMLKANREESSSLLGRTDVAQQIILMDPSQGVSSYRVVLWHELGHAIIDLMGEDWDEAEEEQFISRFMPMTLMVLRDNPLLRSVLFDGAQKK